MNDKARDVPERHCRRILLADPYLDLAAAKARAAPGGGEMEDSPGRVGNPNSAGERPLTVLVGQAHAHVAAPPAARVVLERRRWR